MKIDKIYCSSEDHPDDGCYFAFPGSREYDINPGDLCWSTHQLPDGRWLGIGRSLEGVVMIHIPSAQTMLRDLHA